MSDFSFLPQDTAITALRDSGYKDSGFALAEIIDNSIEAEASKIFVFAISSNDRTSRIYVLDNGVGMIPESLDKNTPNLRQALQYGVGSRTSRKGIGRFGVGLPASSISQCKKLEVYSWQNGFESTYYTYLSVSETENGTYKEIPKPIKKNFDEYLISFLKKHDYDKHFDKSGTLVCWSEIDRLSWSKPESLFRNLGPEIGRIHRKFINSGKVKIYFINATASETSDGFEERNLDSFRYDTFEGELPLNDPNYVTIPCNKVYGDGDLDDKFSKLETFFENPDIENESSLKTKKYLIATVPTLQSPAKHAEVYLSSSVVKYSAIASDGRNPGSTKKGKHAGKNTGISIVRSNRELELEKSLDNNDPKYRFMGVEIGFSAELDEVFGVTNDKQRATLLSEHLKRDEDELRNRNEHYKCPVVNCREENCISLAKLAIIVMNERDSLLTKINTRMPGRQTPPTGYSFTSDELYDIDIITKKLLNIGVSQEIAKKSAERAVIDNNGWVVSKFENEDLQMFLNFEIDNLKSINQGMLKGLVLNMHYDICCKIDECENESPVDLLKMWVLSLEDFVENKALLHEFKKVWSSNCVRFTR